MLKHFEHLTESLISGGEGFGLKIFLEIGVKIGSVLGGAKNCCAMINNKNCNLQRGNFSFCQYHPPLLLSKPALLTGLLNFYIWRSRLAGAVYFWAV